MVLSDDMQHQARALADPSRFRLFRHIVEADRPVDVAELTELLGFNHNAIRQHLAVLTEAGMVAETTEHRTVRGRPRKQYRARADALGAFASLPGSYRRLSELLLTMATTGDTAYDVGYRAGIGAASNDAGPIGDGAEPALDRALGSLVTRLTVDGFEPSGTGPGEATLANCPFADVAATEPGVVCELHRGLIDGHLARLPGGFEGDLVPEQPHRAGCRVTITTADAD